MSTEEEMLDDEMEEEEAEEVEPSTGDEDEFIVAFESMSPDERAEILSELLTLYCPECGKDHAACACEVLDDGN